MRKIIYTVLLMLIAGLSFADQRMETDGNYAHFAFNPANDDNEIYFSPCSNIITTDGAGTANGTAGELGGQRNYCRQTFAGLPWADLYPGVTSLHFDETNFNTTCNMVTSNANAAANAYNLTEYVSNDWDLYLVAEERPMGMYEVTARLICRNGVQQ